MKALILQEEKKIWKRKSTKIAILCILVFIAIMPMLEQDHTRFYTSGTSYITGKEAIEKEKETYAPLKGELNETRLADCIQTIHEYITGKSGQGMETSAALVLNEQMAPYETMMRIIGEPLHTEDVSYDYVDVFEQLDAQDALYVYENWKTYILRKYPEQTELMKSYLDTHVTSFQYGYAHGLSYTGSRYMDLVLTVAIVLIIALSPVFAQERKSGAISLLLSCKQGRTQTTISKLIASLRFSTIVYGCSLLVFYGSTAIFLGLEGGEISMQMAWVYAPMQWSMLELNLLMMLLGYLSIVGITILILFISQYAKSIFKAQTCLLLFLYISYTLQVMITDGALLPFIKLLPFGLVEESVYKGFPLQQIQGIPVFTPIIYASIDILIMLIMTGMLYHTSKKMEV